MRRYSFLILFVIVLIVPFILRTAMGEHSAPLSSSQRLVIVTPHPLDVRREFADAFSAWHQAHYGSPVLLDYRAVGGTEDVRRFLITSYAVPGALKEGIGIDMAWGGGNALFQDELPQNILQPLHLPPSELHQIFPSQTLGGVDLYTDRWVGVCLSSFGIIYNPDICRQLGVPPPRTWNDLTNPRLSGMLALADPTHSGSVAVAYTMVIQRAMADDGQDKGFKRGMATLLLMAANSRYFSDDSTLPVNDVASGEAAAGVAIDFYGLVTSEIVGPDRLRFVLPVNASAVTPDPIAILAGVSGRRLTLAHQFIQFLLSPEGQRIWILRAGVPGGPRNQALHRLPIRRDLYTQDRSNWTDRTDDPFTAAAAFNMHDNWMFFFTDIRPIWAAAWIDDGDELHRAYARILAVPDPVRRANLLAELADLPVTLSDVKADTNARKSAADPDLWAAQRRIQWDQIFRQHYVTVESHAEAAQ
ncbi:MAG TPA: ABC transporter substrate-binding protein [Tepidisphaeraceae bacterium]|nr:ABC transporter substrate-binding protein [Tepidisphaeraceae bacterium]